MTWRDAPTAFAVGFADAVLAFRGARGVGRIERVFRTLKETLFRDACLWLFKSASQIDRYCADFLLFYNRDRPHSAWAGRTPDEVYFGRGEKLAAGRVSYFDGRLLWYRFG